MSAPGSVAVPTGRTSGVPFEQYVHESRLRLYRFAVVLSGDPVLAGDLVTDVLGQHRVAAEHDREPVQPQPRLVHVLLERHA